MMPHLNKHSYASSQMFFSHLTDVFKSALKFGTFSAIMVTYTASALLHVSPKWTSSAVTFKCIFGIKWIVLTQALIPHRV